MENRTRMRVHKSKGFKNGKKHLVKKFVDYLKSDTFMYAPLLSTVPTDLRSPHPLTSPTRVVEFKKPIAENKPFLEQLGDYMKSDVYMYASIVAPPPLLQESLLYTERIRMSVSTTRLTMKVNQPADHLETANQRSENHLPRSGPSDKNLEGHTETVKHTVYQTCHSNSASGISCALNNSFSYICGSNPLPVDADFVIQGMTHSTHLTARC